MKTSNSVYGVENSAAELVRDIIVSDNELVPDGIPEDVQQKFAGELGDVVKEEAAKLYREGRKNINITDDGKISSEAQDVIQELAEQRVQDEY